MRDIEKGQEILGALLLMSFRFDCYVKEQFLLLCEKYNEQSNVCKDLERVYAQHETGFIHKFFVARFCFHLKSYSALFANNVFPQVSALRRFCLFTKRLARYNARLAYLCSGGRISYCISI